MEPLIDKYGVLVHSANDGLIIRYPPDWRQISMPFLPKLNIDLNVQAVNYQNARRHETNGLNKLLLWFVNDARFDPVLKTPFHYYKKVHQYEYVSSIDFSFYPDMPLSEQFTAVYLSRLIGRYWLDNGIKVLPTVGWSDAASLCFCFDGIAEESDVVISTLGAKKRPDLFWPGFIELEKRVHPHTIFCYGKQFPGMHRFGNVVIMPYAGDIAKRKQIAGQIQMVVPS